VDRVTATIKNFLDAERNMATMIDCLQSMPTIWLLATHAILASHD